MADDILSIRARDPLSVSILVPSYNPGSYLNDALRSVLDENISVEVIVQDACSGQETLEVLNSFADRISTHIETDAGQADALNKAFARSSGAIIGWLNADDVYSPNTLQRVSQAFRDNPQLDVVYGDHALIDSHGAQLRRYDVGPWTSERLLRRGCYIFSGATFWRREVFERHGLFRTDLNYCMDYEFFLRIAPEVSTLHLPFVLGALRIHPASKTGGSGWQFLPEGYRVRKEYSEYGSSRLTAALAGGKDAVYIALQRVRYSRLWSQHRPRRRL